MRKQTFVRSLPSLLHGLMGLGAVVVLAPTLDACSNNASLAALAQSCNINSDCTSPLVCAFQSCHIQCKTSEDCPTGDVCVQSDRPFLVCEAPIACTLNSQCPANQVCGVDGLCRNACETSRDCISGQSCVDNTCVDQAQLKDGGLPRADATVDAGGFRCVHNSDCPANTIFLDLGVCGVECLTAKDCELGQSCQGGECVTPPPPPVDAGKPDTTVVDSGKGDVSVVDSAPHETGPHEAGPAETGPIDSGASDVRETGPVDSGKKDAAMEAEAPMLPAAGLPAYPNSTPNFAGGVFYDGIFYVNGGDGNGTVYPLYGFNPNVGPDGGALQDGGAVGDWFAAPETNLPPTTGGGSEIVLSGSDLYAFGGSYNPSCSSYNSVLRKYDFPTSTWSTVSDASTAGFVGRSTGAATVYNGVFYSYAGLTCSSPGMEANTGGNYYNLASMLKYDFATSTWTSSNPANAPHPFFLTAGVLVGDVFYIMGGVNYQDGTKVPNLYAYDFTADSFTVLASNVVSNYGAYPNFTRPGVCTDGTKIHIVVDGMYAVYDIGKATITSTTTLPAYATFLQSIAGYYNGSIYIKDANSAALARVNAN